MPKSITTFTTIPKIASKRETVKSIFAIKTQKNQLKFFMKFTLETTLDNLTYYSNE